MTRAFLTLFLFGLTAGAFSVAVGFLRRSLSGEYPDRVIPFPKEQKRKERRRRRGMIVSFLLDLFLSLLTGLYLVLYDATVLGGRGRPVHLAFFFGGLFFSRFVFLSLFYRQTERAFRFAFDLLYAGIWCLCFPFRKCFSLLFGFLCSLYLIMKRKNDKMKWKRQAKRETARLYREMETAFLPPDLTGALIPGRK